jgi:hypothetical protein
MEYTLNVAASFSLYQEISDMYREVNDQHIEPGLGIVDRMGSQTAAGELEAKKQQLAEYSKSASEGIGAIIKRVCYPARRRDIVLTLDLENRESVRWIQEAC